eukprot:scaffold70094_cov65-Phaeocystis_antarctica.AAC.2
MQGSADEHWPALLGLAKRIPGSVHEVAAAPGPAALQPRNPAALPTRGRSPMRASSQLTYSTYLLTHFLFKVNRVIFVLGEPIAEPPRTVTPTVLSKPVVSQLRAADNIVTQVLTARGLVRKLAQVPVVLFPVGFGIEGARSIGIRAFLTRDFMTGTPALPGSAALPLEALAEIQSRILAEVPGIARVALDISPKPPATTEWE